MSSSDKLGSVGDEFSIGNVTGYPGVFQGNPHPYPWEPAPAFTGAGFRRYGSWVLYQNPESI